MNAPLPTPTAECSLCHRALAGCICLSRPPRDADTVDPIHPDEARDLRLLDEQLARWKDRP